jgi:3-hydroxyisobutyrate dehydrogenase
MKTEPRTKAGFIGLGGMGAPMAHNLHQAGFLHTVWNRGRPRLDAFLAGHDVVPAGDPQSLARDVDVIFTCLSADRDLLQVVEQLLPGVDRDAVLVDCSTVNRDTAVTIAQRLGERGAAFLDAPVSGGVEGARKGTLAMMIGGDARDLSRVRPLLETLAARIEHMGPVGAGQATKAVNQIMAAGINQAVTEALAFARAQQLPLDKVIDVVAGGAAGNWFLEQRGPSMVRQRFDPGFRVALHHKDLSICRDMAARHGVSLPLVEMTLIHYQRLMDAGFGDEDISALFRSKVALFEPERD